MKCAVQRLQLQREIVFITDYAFLETSVGESDHYLATILPAVWRGIHDGPPDVRRRATGGKSGEVRRDEAAGAPGHVALSALRGAAKKDFAALRISQHW